MSVNPSGERCGPLTAYVETGPGLILQAITSPKMIQVATLVAARKGSNAEDTTPSIP